MLAFEIKIGPPLGSLTARDHKRFGDIIAEEIRRNVAEGLDGADRPLAPDIHGSDQAPHVHLRRTNRMLGTLGTKIAVAKGTLVRSDAPYARVVNRRYRFMGITRRARQRLQVEVRQAVLRMVQRASTDPAQRSQGQR